MSDVTGEIFFLGPGPLISNMELIFLYMCVMHNL